MAQEQQSNGQESNDAGENSAFIDTGRNSKILPLNLVKFLEVLRQTGNVSYSAREIGWSRSTIYAFANKNPSYKQAMKEAVDEARDLLLAEGWKRATTWTTHEEGESKHIKPPSDKLLQFLLQGYFKELNAANKEEVSQVDEIVPSNADLTLLDDDELQVLEKVLTKLGSNASAVTS